MTNVLKIFTDQALDGNSLEFTIDQVEPMYKQDPFIGITGEFGGATVKLQWNNPDNVWSNTDPVNDIWTDVVQFPVFMNSFSKYRLNISNAGVSTNINAWVFGGKAAD